MHNYDQSPQGCGASRVFHVQWHLTNRCQNRCKHCYIYDDDVYQKSLAEELSLVTIQDVFDQIQNGARERNRLIFLHLTGGDPLLFDGFSTFLEFVHGKAHSIAIMGNPDVLRTDIAKQLRHFGIHSFQMSLDGPQPIHDSLRSEGSFEKLRKGSQLLKNVGIKVHLMMTLSTVNEPFLEETMRIASGWNADLFAFARLSSYGNGTNLNLRDWTPIEYRSILLRYIEEHRRLLSTGSKTHFGRKENLFTLLYKDFGIIPGSELHRSGCGIGRGVSILPDGTVYACRRFFSPIGNVLQTNFWNIVEGNEFSSFMREDKFVKCRSCGLMRNCRGCPAVTFNVNGDFYSPDPQCWA